MSDDHLRETERRWRESGSQDDELAYLQALRRAGRIDDHRLQVAADCGHRTAARLTSLEPLWDDRALYDWARGLLYDGPTPDPPHRLAPRYGDALLTMDRDARRILRGAVDQARRLGTWCVGSEALLLAGIDQLAPPFLLKHGVDLDAATASVQEIVVDGPPPAWIANAPVPLAILPLTPRCSAILRAAAEAEFRISGWGLLRATARAPQSVARQVLLNLGVTPEELL